MTNFIMNKAYIILISIWTYLWDYCIILNIKRPPLLPDYPYRDEVDFNMKML